MRHRNSWRDRLGMVVLILGFGWYLLLALETWVEGWFFGDREG